MVNQMNNSQSIASKLPKRHFRRLLVRFMVVLFSVPGITLIASADDTELYQATLAPSATGRPKVLIMIDESGSMASTVTTRPPYDPNTTYTGVHPAGRLYWSDSGQPPSINSSRWVSADTNRCAAAVTPLAQQGYYQDRLIGWYERKLRFLLIVISEGWRWGSLSAPLFRFNDNFTHLECFTDIDGEDSSNPGAAAGFPQNTTTNGQEYGNAVDNNVSFDDTYSVFTSNYMNWYYDTSLQEVAGTRLEIAQSVITDLIEANPGIDFGLAVFNDNRGSNDDGGRIVQGIIENMTAQNRSDLVDLIDDELMADGGTPLCEATFEAYRYLAGESVLYGLENSSSPGRDTSVESGGDYISPATDCAYTYIILLTDGRPTNDTDANQRIKDIPGADIDSCGTYLTDNTDFLGRPQFAENCLPELADYMANNDLDGDSSNGNQYGITYTIGFLTDQLLLSDTATRGKGAYFTAEDPEGLTDAFRGAVTSILDTDTTFTSPAVAVDTFTRTQSLKQVFFAMFRPDNQVDWPGNIKRLDLAVVDGQTVLVDSDGDPAIDEEKGEILETATTEWSTEEDGADVLKGGVGALLAARTPSTRVLYTNTGANDVLEPFAPISIDPAAFGFNGPIGAQNVADLLDFFGASTALELRNIIRWAQGYTISEDGTTVSDISRGWLLSDILHSQPVVVNYGAYGSATAENPDLRIVVGTNGGFLHMFNNDGINPSGAVAGGEDWAFFPKELGPILKKRRDNEISADHVYGVDSPAVIYTYDDNLDGTINHTAGDKVYVYFGLRRGGQLMYALDISDPDSPSLLWKIDPTVAGFSELGYTWSVPVVTLVPGYTDVNDKPLPVLVFGAGYDENKDGTGIATADSIGRGIFVVDAATGELVWSITPGADSDTNLQETGLTHSVPASVTVLDTNGNSLADRMYFSDSGGQLWRVDLPGNTLPGDVDELDVERRDAATWRVTKIAEVNESDPALDQNNGTAVPEADRRFFNGVDVVRTVCDDLPFDALIIGSGDRTNPLATDVDNQLYMFRDLRLSPYVTDPPSDSECNDLTDPSTDFRCELPLAPGDLYDVTDNLIQVGDTNAQTNAGLALNAANGWVLNLLGNGEKSLARTITLAGYVFAPTFQPDSGNSNVCEPTPGNAQIYAVKLCDATERLDPITELPPLPGDPPRDPMDAPPGILEQPSLIYNPDGTIDMLWPGMDPVDSDEGLRSPYGSYWFREEK